MLHFHFFDSLWLGLLTSFTPCVIGAALTMLAYITQKTNDRKQIVTYSFFYAFGRAVFYMALTLILYLFVDNIHTAKSFLENRANIIIGIIMIFISLMLLDIINLHLPNFKIVEIVRSKTEKSKYFSSFLFGLLFAGMFCPVTASLFLTNFLHHPSMVSAFVYGFSTGFFMLLLTFVMIFCEDKFSLLKKNTEKIKKYASRITGIIFFLMGVGLIFKLF